MKLNALRRRTEFEQAQEIARAREERVADYIEARNNNEPISLETRAFDYQVALDDVEEAAAEFCEARAGSAYTDVMKASAKLDEALTNAKHAARRLERTEKRAA